MNTHRPPTIITMQSGQQHHLSESYTTIHNKLVNSSGPDHLYELHDHQSHSRILIRDKYIESIREG